jgi:hypothetical protein
LFHFDQLPIGSIKIVCLQQEKWVSGGKTLIKMKQVRETSYLTILRPTLEYAAMVCDPTTQTLIQTLENVQKELPASS